MRRSMMELILRERLKGKTNNYFLKITLLQLFSKFVDLLTICHMHKVRDGFTELVR